MKPVEITFSLPDKAAEMMKRALLVFEVTAYTLDNNFTFLVYLGDDLSLLYCVFRRFVTDSLEIFSDLAEEGETAYTAIAKTITVRCPAELLCKLLLHKDVITYRSPIVVDFDDTPVLRFRSLGSFFRFFVSLEDLWEMRNLREGFGFKAN